MSEEKALSRLDSMPVELLHKIYGYLFEVDNTRFDFEKTKFVKVDLKRSWAPRNQPTYVFPVALLRVNKKFNQGAQRVLYNDNLLVLIRLMNVSDDFEPAILHITRKFPSCRYIPIGFVPDKRSLPPCPVVIHHRRHEVKALKRPGSLAMVVSAFDLHDLCRMLSRKIIYYDVPEESYSLMALLKAGWRHEQLRSLIWEPLSNLRQSIAWVCVGYGTEAKYYEIKVVEATGTFEPTVKMLEWDAEPEHQFPDFNSDEEQSPNKGGYRTEFFCEQTCLTSGGCPKEYDTDNAEWKTENSYSEPDLDSDAGSEGQFRSHTSRMETRGADIRAYSEQKYFGDDELTDDDPDVRKGRKKQMRTRRRKRWIRVSRYDHSQKRWIAYEPLKKIEWDILAKRDWNIGTLEEVEIFRGRNTGYRPAPSNLHI